MGGAGKRTGPIKATIPMSSLAPTNDLMISVAPYNIENN